MGILATKPPPVHTLNFEVIPIGPYPDRENCIWSLPVRKDPDLIIIVLIEYFSGKPVLYVHVTVDEREQVQVILDALDSILRNSSLNLRFVQKIGLFCRALRIVEKDDPILKELKELNNFSTLPHAESGETFYRYKKTVFAGSEECMEKNEIYAIYVKKEHKIKETVPWIPTRPIKKELVLAMKLIFPAEGWKAEFDTSKFEKSCLKCACEDFLK